MQGIKVSELPERRDDPSAEVTWPRRDVAQIVLLGEHDMTTAATLERTIDQALNQSSHLVIDLRQTEFLDSSTIRRLVGAQRRADLLGARFNVLIGSGTIVRRALELTEVLGTLNAVGSLEDAIEHNPIGEGHSNGTTPHSA